MMIFHRMNFIKASKGSFCIQNNRYFPELNMKLYEIVTQIIQGFFLNAIA